MEIQPVMKEIGVLVEGEKPPLYGQLINILFESQKFAEQEHGPTAIAVYRVAYRGYK
jgi:hypothetical protein